jgi:hypothetical protein
MRQEGDVGFWEHVGGVLAIRTMPESYRMARTMPPKKTKGVRETLNFLTTFMVFQNFNVAVNANKTQKELVQILNDGLDENKTLSMYQQFFTRLLRWRGLALTAAVVAMPPELPDVDGAKNTLLRDIFIFQHVMKTLEGSLNLDEGQRRLSFVRLAGDERQFKQILSGGGGGEKQEKTKDKTHKSGSFESYQEPNRPRLAVNRWLKLVASYQDPKVRGVDYQYLLDIDQCFKTEKDVDPVQSLQLQDHLEKTIAKQNDTLVQYASVTKEIVQKIPPEELKKLSLASQCFLESVKKSLDL